MITIYRDSAILRYDYPIYWDGIKKVKVKKNIVSFIQRHCSFDDGYGGYVIYEILADR